MEKYQNKYRNDTARLKNWDYGIRGFYFVTICTQNRVKYFGDIITPNTVVVGTQNFASLPPNPPPTPPTVQHTPIGKIAHQYWMEIPNHFPFVKPDEFIIMPDHVHGILHFNKPYRPDWKPNTFGPQSQNLASVVRGYKAATKKYATMHDIEFAWQSRYHDHIIRSEKNLHAIRAYIKDNPAKWMQDHALENYLL